MCQKDGNMPRSLNYVFDVCEEIIWDSTVPAPEYVVFVAVRGFTTDCYITATTLLICQEVKISFLLNLNKK